MLFMAKEIRINVRTSAETKRDLEIAAKLRGISPSSLVNFAVTQIIREEKERDPAAFRKPVGQPVAPESKTPILKAKTRTEDKRKAQ